MDQSASEIAVDLLKRNAAHELDKMTDIDKRKNVARCMDLLKKRKTFCRTFGKQWWL